MSTIINTAPHQGEAQGYRTFSRAYQQAQQDAQRDADPAVQRAALDRLRYLGTLNDDDLARLDAVVGLQSDLQDHRLDQFNDRVESFIASEKWREFPWVSGSGNGTRRFTTLREWMTAPVHQGGLGIQPVDFIALVAGTRGNTVDVIEALWESLSRQEKLAKREQLYAIAEGGARQWRKTPQHGRWNALLGLLADEGRYTVEERTSKASKASAVGRQGAGSDRHPPQKPDGGESRRLRHATLRACAHDPATAERRGVSFEACQSAWAAFTRDEKPIALNPALLAAGLAAPTQKQGRGGVVSLPFRSRADAELAKRIADHATATGYADRIEGLARELLKLAGQRG